MADARRPSLVPSASMSADQVARRSFVMARRGYDPAEVRSFLEWVAAGLDAGALREEDLRRRLEDAQQRIAEAERRAANPQLDEPTLTAALGQETAKVLRSAHEAANELTARAEETAARLLRQADEDSARLHDRAASVLSERTEEAEAAAAELRRAARSESSAVVAEARREAETLLERTREECREMVRETQELRARILGDLARRRRILYTQVEQLRAGKGSLTESLSGVRRSVDQIHEGLRRAEEEARVAADSAARRVAAEPEPTGEELARAAQGVPLRSSTLDGGEARLVAGPAATEHAGAVSPVPASTSPGGTPGSTPPGGKTSAGEPVEEVPGDQESVPAARTDVLPGDGQPVAPPERGGAATAAGPAPPGKRPQAGVAHGSAVQVGPLSGRGLPEPASPGGAPAAGTTPGGASTGSPAPGATPAGTAAPGITAPGTAAPESVSVGRTAPGPAAPGPAGGGPTPGTSGAPATSRAADSARGESASGESAPVAAPHAPAAAGTAAHEMHEPGTAACPSTGRSGPAPGAPAAPASAAEILTAAAPSRGPRNEGGVQGRGAGPVAAHSGQPAREHEPLSDEGTRGKQTSAGPQSERSGTASSRSPIPGRANHPAEVAARRAADAAATTARDTGMGDSGTVASSSEGSVVGAEEVAGGSGAGAPDAASSAQSQSVPSGRRGEERRLSSLRLIRRSRGGGGRGLRPEPSSDVPPDDDVEGVRILERAPTLGTRGETLPTGEGFVRGEASPPSTVQERAGTAGAGSGSGEAVVADAAAEASGKVPDEVGEEAVNALFARIRASRAAALAGGEGDRPEDTDAQEPTQETNGARGSDEATHDQAESPPTRGARNRPGGSRSTRQSGRGRRGKERVEAAVGTAASEPEPGSVATAERDETSPRSTRTAAEERRTGKPARETVPPLSPEEEILQRRDAMLEPIVAALARKLKRALQDEQNDALDRLRSRKARSALEVLAGEPEQHERYRQVSQAFLVEAAIAGAIFAGAGEGAKAPPGAAEEEAVELARAVVGPLRRRIDAGVSELVSGDEAALVDHIGAAYREWKGQRIERLAGDHVTGAFARGAMEMTPGDAMLSWIVDDEGAHCPDCDDNALAGPLRRGEAFPTGQEHPPAHPGCRCLLVTAST